MFDTRRLEARCRRAYEAGRLRQALLGALLVPVLALAALALGAERTTVGTVVPGLSILVVGLLWVGGVVARGVRPGLLAGLGPLALPLLTMQVADGYCTPGLCQALCLWSCAGSGGVAAGLVLWATARLRARRLPAVAIGIGLAGFTGAMGCAPFGWLGLAGMTAGLAVGMAPALFLTLRRA